MRKEVLTTWSSLLKAWLHSSSSLSLSPPNFLSIPLSFMLNPLSNSSPPFSSSRLVCLCLPPLSPPSVSSRPHGQRLGPRHRSHRGHPHRHLLPAAGGRRRHLLLPQQVRTPHVHRRELLWEGRPRGQEQGHRGGQGRLHVSPSRNFFKAAVINILYIINRSCCSVHSENMSHSDKPRENHHKLN